MAALTLKSERQIQSDMLATLISELGLNDINAGSVLDVLTQASSQEDFAQYVAMAQIVRLTDLDNITGDDLDNKAFEVGLTRQQALKAAGTVDILRPASFVKVSTSFYAGSPAPVVGATSINVNDASDALYSTSGTLILGRGTANEEEVTYVLAPVDNTNFWTFTVSALANNHAIEETVILKQGSDQVILVGTSVRVPSTGTSVEILFVTDNDVTLLAGEDKVTGVEVTAVLAGTSGNIPIKAIEGTQAFSSEPFAGARAENPVKFTTGKDRQSDDELRDAIRSHLQSLSKGVKQAILNAIVGLVDPETAKRVVSANVILPQDTNTPVKVYIDDGLGFEPSFTLKGFEDVVVAATGGEKRLQIDVFPLVKAQIENNIEEFYNMSGGSKTLIYTVGTDSETITFQLSDFEFPDTATAEEIVTSINDNATLIEARTSQSGKQVTIQSKVDTNEDIQVTGGTSNSILGFPTDLKSTLFLYIDDLLKSKDGETAFLDSGNAAPYNLIGIGAFPHTLTIVVDGKTTNTQTVTFQAVDFSDTSAATVAEINAVIAAQLAGVTPSSIENATKVRLLSNTELSVNSKVRVTGGSANDVTNGLNFSTIEKVGINGDYTLNRELGTVELNDVLTVDQSVTLGSKFTRASLRASVAELYSPANGETLLVDVDAGGNQTVTFDATFVGGKTAVDTAAFINLQLVGATASARTIGTSTFLEITTDTQDESNGSIEIDSASTASSSFSFTEDTLISNQRPHKAFQVGANVGPFDFAEGDSLVTVLDNDSVNNTFAPVMDFDGTVTSGSSTTVFAATAFSTIFTSDDELIDFFAAFTSGANTTSETAVTVTNQGGDTWRYDFDSLPTNMADFAVADIIRVSGMQNVGNNGNFIVTGFSSAGNGFVEVTNTSGVAESVSTGTILIGQRRQVTDYTTATGSITVGSAFRATPSGSDTFIVLPSTITNLVDFLGNTSITSLSLKAVTEGVENNTKLQISSLKEGSDGFVQVTGGAANTLIGFPTTILRGLQAYTFFTGLTKLVSKTIYGDDTDLVSFGGVGAAGIQFQVLAPTVREVSIILDVTLAEGISITSLENAIKSAVTGYVNNLGVGGDVIIEELRSRTIQINGIIDVVLTAPAANIAIADNELARTKDSRILIG